MLKPHSNISGITTARHDPEDSLSPSALDSPLSPSVFSHALSFFLCECERTLGGVPTATFCG